MGCFYWTKIANGVWEAILPNGDRGRISRVVLPGGNPEWKTEATFKKPRKKITGRSTCFSVRRFAAEWLLDQPGALMSFGRDISPPPTA